MLPIGSAVLIENAGDGWFPLAPTTGIRGNVFAVIHDSPESEPAYVLKLTESLEIQETGRPTISGFRQCIFDHLLVRSRHPGYALGEASDVMVDVVLLDPSKSLPNHFLDIKDIRPRITARCRVLSKATTNEEPYG